MVTASGLLLATTLAVLGFLSAVSAHTVMYSPIPRGSEMNKDYGKVDYSLKEPLNDVSGQPFPCKHKLKKGVKPTATYTAGQNFTAIFEDGNTHRGGHCQFAMSFDGDQTFVVLRTVLDVCFMDYAPWAYHIPLPKEVPNGNATFLWGWFNAEGNEQMYTNCADVEIKGGVTGGSLTGPGLLKARLKGSPRIKEWSQKNSGDIGHKLFADRKTVTTPKGAAARPGSTIKGEPCNGSMGNRVPSYQGKIPWNRFHDDDGHRSGAPFKRKPFHATSANPGQNFAGLTDGGRTKKGFKTTSKASAFPGTGATGGVFGKPSSSDAGAPKPELFGDEGGDKKPKAPETGDITDDGSDEEAGASENGGEDGGEDGGEEGSSDDKEEKGKDKGKDKGKGKGKGKNKGDEESDEGDSKDDKEDDDDDE